MSSSAYPLASLGHAAWILQHYGYRAVFIWGLCLYGVGALLAIPAIKAWMIRMAAQTAVLDLPQFAPR